MPKSEAEKSAARKVRFWHTWLKPVRALLKGRFAYTCPIVDVPDGAFLLYANHVTDLDPVFVGASFREPLTFVAGENVQRMGKLSKIINRYADTIDRVKGTTDSACALQILRTLRKGKPVCMFPSGNRSYTGQSTPIFPASAKLAKSARVPLITYKLTGGYMTSPRWADTMRKGSMHGDIVHIYTPEEMAAMSNDELLACITADLWEDAYDAAPIPYKGKRLAERLETMLYLCPRCGCVDTLKSRDNVFSCDCGLTMTMQENGRFTGVKLPFAHPGEWDAWQQTQVRRLAEDAGEAPVFSDAGQQLYQLGDNHELLPITAGTLSLSGTALTLGRFSVPLSKVEGIALTQQEKLSFSANGLHYVILSDHHRCGKKYCDLFRYLNE